MGVGTRGTVQRRTVSLSLFMSLWLLGTGYKHIFFNHRSFELVITTKEMRFWIVEVEDPTRFLLNTPVSRLEIPTSRISNRLLI